MKIPERPPFANLNEFSDTMAELIRIEKWQEFLDMTDNKYYYWDKCKYIANSWGFDAKKLWSAIKANRLTNRIIVPSTLPKFTFRLATPSVVQRFLHEFDLNLGGSILGDTIIPSEDRERYLISSLMEEAIASSQLEGAATTRKVAKEMLETNRKPRDISEQMILNNYEAMKWIVENKQQPFSISNIQHIHKILSRHTHLSKEEVGAFREDDLVRVVDTQTGKVLHTPPPFEQLDQLMKDFCHFANNDEDRFFIHPISKGIILHFLIGYIHPFADGNGRTARSVFYWYLLKHGYWLIEYMSVSRIILASKAQYAKAYLHTELDANDLTYFLLYNLKSIHLALEDLKKYIKRKIIEKKNVITMLRHTAFNDRQIILVQEIIEDPTSYFTVQKVQNIFGVSNQTARNDLSNLVTEGILEERKNAKAIRYIPTRNYLTRLKQRPVEA